MLCVSESLWFGQVNYCADLLTFQLLNRKSDLNVYYLHASKTQKYCIISVFKLNQLNIDYAQLKQNVCLQKEFKECSVEIGREGSDAALCDLRVLVLVLTDAVEVLDVAGPSKQLHEVLVVGDDQQLEVTLAGATLDDSGESEREETVQTDCTGAHHKEAASCILSVQSFHHFISNSDLKTKARLEVEEAWKLEHSHCVCSFLYFCPCEDLTDFVDYDLVLGKASCQ